MRYIAGVIGLWLLKFSSNGVLEMEVTVLADEEGPPVSLGKVDLLGFIEDKLKELLKGESVSLTSGDE